MVLMTTLLLLHVWIEDPDQGLKDRLSRSLALRALRGPELLDKYKKHSWSNSFVRLHTKTIPTYLKESHQGLAPQPDSTELVCQGVSRT